MKRFAVLLLTLAMAFCCAAPAFAAGTIEVTEDVSVSDDYDWTRFQGQNLTLNVYNWGEYISNGSDDSVDVVAAFEKLTGIKVNYTTFDSNESMYAKMCIRDRSQAHHSGRADGRPGPGTGHRDPQAHPGAGPGTYGHPVQPYPQ